MRLRAWPRPNLVRIGARPGDVLQLTGRTVGVARADLQPAGERGTIQVDGTLRGNCGAGLQELVSVTRVEHGTAVSVRLTSAADGSAQAAISLQKCSKTWQVCQFSQVPWSVCRPSPSP